MAGMPRLRLTTRTLYVEAFDINQLKAARTFETEPTPTEFRTRRLTILARGAMPMNSPLEKVPFPAGADAACVPCPYGSSVRPSPVKSTLTTIRERPVRVSVKELCAL